MADEPAPATGAEPAAEAQQVTDTPKGPDVPEGAQNPDAVKRALEAERKAAKEAAKRAEAAEAKLAEREEADKSELEKAQGKLTKAEERAAKAEASLLRYEVAKDKEIPAEAADLLSGTTREELEASADKILALVKNRTNTEKEPDFDGGAREPASDPKKPEDAHNADILKLLGIAPGN